VGCGGWLAVPGAWFLVGFGGARWAMRALWGTWGRTDGLGSVFVFFIVVFITWLHAVCDIVSAKLESGVDVRIGFSAELQSQPHVDDEVIGEIVVETVSCRYACCSGIITPT
jgi:hypothetical protein